MSFYFVGEFSEARLYSVWIYRALHQKVGFGFLGNLFEDSDEFLSNDSSFLLWVNDSLQPSQKSVLSAHWNKIDVEITEGRVNEFGFSLPHEPMIDKDRSQVVA